MQGICKYSRLHDCLNRRTYCALVYISLQPIFQDMCWQINHCSEIPAKRLLLRRSSCTLGSPGTTVHHCEYLHSWLPAMSRLLVGPGIDTPSQSMFVQGTCTSNAQAENHSFCVETGIPYVGYTLQMAMS